MGGIVPLREGGYKYPLDPTLIPVLSNQHQSTRRLSQIHNVSLLAQRRNPCSLEEPPMAFRNPGPAIRASGQTPFSPAYPHAHLAPLRLSGHWFGCPYWLSSFPKPLWLFHRHVHSFPLPREPPLRTAKKAHYKRRLNLQPLSKGRNNV